MKYYIADTHFGHKNIIKMDNRPFSDIMTMDEKIISNWNRRVNSDDEVYIVGDLVYKSRNHVEYYLKQLKGKKYLILGNHDNHLIRDINISDYFEDVKEIMSIEDNGVHIELCHYPMIEWKNYFRNSYHIYGHIHNNKNKTFYIMRNEERALNAGCMINNYEPVTFQELILNNQEFKRIN